MMAVTKTLSEINYYRAVKLFETKVKLGKILLILDLNLKLKVDYISLLSLH